MARRGSAGSVDIRPALKGIDRMLGQVEQGAVEKGMMPVAQEILTDIKASGPGIGVPVDEGTLRDSGRVVVTGPRTLSIVFGGAAAPYALVQHEVTTIRHTVGEARYITRAVDRYRFDGSSALRAIRRQRFLAAARLAASGGAS